jgi:hypothetical protein
MAKQKSTFDPYKRPPSINKHASKYGGGDGLELDAKLNSQANQDPIDKHCPGYSNDVPVSAWTRGGSQRPGFDSGPSGNRYGKGK